MNKEKEYIDRINRVFDYIDLNIDKKINLDTLAEVACFSKYHFHRIFYSFTDESLYSYINRLRVERAAALLLTQKRTITSIAFSCGFNDSATFSRAFRKHFRISPSAWIKKKNSKIDQEYKINTAYIYSRDLIKESITKAAVIEEKTLQAMTVVYIRYTGSYARNNSLFHSLHKMLMDWGQERKLLNYPATKDVIIYHDPIGITDENRLRISVGITVSDDVLVSGEIGKLTIPNGRYIICRFELKNDEYGQAWTHVYRKIIPQRGLQPRDSYCFEMYPCDCYNKESKTTTVDICIPIKQL